MTTAELRALTRKELETMAKRLNVSGRHSMRKEALIKTLVSVRRKKRKTVDGKGINGVSAANLKLRKSGGSNGQAGSSPKKAAKNGQSVKSPVGKPIRLMSPGDFKNGSSPDGAKDRLTVQVLDSHWLYAVWILSGQIIERARVALGLEWHQAVPVIRLFEICGDEESSVATTWVKDIEIQGDSDHWYVPVDSVHSYKLKIGYRTACGNFFTLACSNKVTTLQENASTTTERILNGRQSSRDNDAMHTGCFDNNGKDDEKAQPRLLKNDFNSIEVHAIGSEGNGSDPHEINKDHLITVQTQLIIHGRTHPDSKLTCLGDAVSLDKSGRFSLRLAFPEGRHVIPVEAVTPDGKEKYTTVLGIMRNTKKLGPQSMAEPLL